MARITIDLDREMSQALYEIAAREFRDPHAQIKLILREEFCRLGILNTVTTHETLTDSNPPKEPSK